ncbi:NAD(P)H-dependent oxidoreductase subunit E [Candidatus Contendibacter odensensis]|uniref:NADH-quinone oxidoreductase subunit F n=1 Tax=Candidatus Contendobacter odensis Run_B_J11 TaxID=1400861 RepID=A0A7U7J1Z6_9GAMM|nr:NAD(P)H-dependent oxidoreductase subunit E [Candidatus Contendobacter odensis]MBK8752792.1 NAD(P)H-dependent oxidoreductase subunit E [Candidatus Competibacteraceae bacterium]CDH44353.1 NAD(P)-dependent nickel-iron dehydrogenase flavin-containing subunit [Candidatus Contendobacter odensis Run_B_J11]
MAESSTLAQTIHDIVQRHNSVPTRLLQILREVQDSLTWLSPEAIERVADEIGLSPDKVQRVAEFYSFLYTAPRGSYDILFSDNITDRMLGNRRLLRYLCDLLGVGIGQTRADNRVSIGVTSCTGLCDQGPAALVNGYALPRLDKPRLDRIAELINSQTPLSEWPQDFFEVTSNIRRADILLGRHFADGAALRAVLKRGSQAILEELIKSGLRGQGGAGYKLALKWISCHDAPGEVKYVVCNADEGEPGTFKDRVLMQEYADLVFEGMTLCGRVIGARQGFVYLRGEYRYLLDSLKATLQRRREIGLLGQSILGESGFDFDIDIHLGAGAYVCGEESALIESLEGKHGVPRIRPPFPTTHGYLNKPTVVNNVETFAVTAKIATEGGAWFASRGTAESKGTKLLSVSGDCERPGIYEYPFGVTVRRVLEDCGARDAQGIQMAGPAGHTISPKQYDRRICFDDLATGGSFMVFAKHRDILDGMRNFAHFFVHESCGFCTPCRVGTSLMRDLVDKVHTGHGARADLDEMRRLGRIMKAASHCGLGQTAPNSVLDSLDQFPEAWERRLRSTSYEPAFDLDAALSEARRLSGRDDPGAHLPDEQSDLVRLAKLLADQDAPMSDDERNLLGALP